MIYCDLDEIFSKDKSTFTHLIFHAFFDACVDILVTSHLTNITFGDYFNQNVDNLPSSLVHLTFGAAFDRPVDRLPASLKHITFGRNFNEKVNHLPTSLTHLTFGYSFFQEVDHLPRSLQYLVFGRTFDQPLDVFLDPSLPSMLVCLIVDLEYNIRLPAMPPSLRTLRCPADVIPIPFPAHLSSFHCLDADEHNMDFIRNCSSLTSIRFTVEFNQSVDDLPPNLKKITFGICFYQPIDNLPPSLTHLKFAKSSRFSNPIKNLPNSLTHLKFGRAFDSPLVGNLPPTLHSLTIGDNYTQPLSPLPPSLRILTVLALDGKGRRDIEVPPILHALRLKSYNHNEVKVVVTFSRNQ